MRFEPSLKKALASGFSAWKAGDLKAAQRIFEQIHEAIDDPDAWSGLGHVRWSRKEWAACLEAFLHAARLDPFSPAHWANLGLAYRELGMQDAALNVLRVASIVDSNFAPAYNEWANVLYDMRRYHEAVHLYSRSLRLDPSRAVVHHNLGMCRQALSQTKGAKKAFLCALRRDPNYHYSLQMLDSYRR
jgi:tetratricopeptide (TPR) repeat protein